MRRAVLAALLLVACDTDESGRSDVVPIFYLEASDEHPPETLAGAAEILGLELDHVPSGSGGAVILFNRRSHGGYRGQTDYVERCAPMSWAEDDPQTVAHEIGHALGLGHVDDPDNLMHEGGYGEELTDEQIDAMRWGAWWLLHAC